MAQFDVYRLAPQLMAAVPARTLTDRLGSIAGERDNIVAAIDLLVTGI
ncbi:CcdB family protein [Zhengella sp. ZM62]